MKRKKLHLKCNFNNILYWGCMGFVLSVCAFYALSLSFKTMPPTEGWYTNYAQMINRGEVVYRDFSYLFFPFYIQLIAAFTKIFGYSIFALRILGVVFFTATGLVAYCLFSKIVSAPGATVASLATVMFLQSEVVQLFYDYIRVMDLTIYLAVLFLLIAVTKIIDETSTKSLLTVAVLCGLFGSFAAMTKQSTGVLFLVYCTVLFLFLALVLPKSNMKRIFYALGAFLGSIVLSFTVMFSWLAYNHALKAFFKNTTGKAIDAKGGILTVLFRWIGVSLESFSAQIWKVLLLVLVIVGVRILASTMFARKLTPVSDKIIVSSFFAIIAVIGLIGCYTFKEWAAFFAQKFNSELQIVSFLFSTIVFVSLGLFLLYFRFGKAQTADADYLKKIKQAIPLFVLSGCIFAISYGSGISGGLCESQTALGLGYLLAVAFWALERSKAYTWGGCVVALFGCFIIVTSGARKIVSPYAWWGLSASELWNNTETVEVPLLKHIKVDAKTKEMYEGVVQAIETYSSPEDSIFCFPHIPIFYSLSGRKSVTYTQVQWFDVSSMDDIQNDINILQDDPPSVIVLCEVPEFVTVSHEVMFNGKRTSQLRLMNLFLHDFISQNQYEAVDAYSIETGYAVKVYARKSAKPNINKIDYRSYLDNQFKKYQTYFKQVGVKLDNAAWLSSERLDLQNALEISEGAQITSEMSTKKILQIIDSFSGQDLIIDRLSYQKLLDDPSIAKEALQKDYVCVGVTDDFVVLTYGRKNVSSKKAENITWESKFGIYAEELLSEDDQRESEAMLTRSLGAVNTFNWWSNFAKVSVFNYSLIEQEAKISLTIRPQFQRSQALSKVKMTLGELEKEFEISDVQSDEPIVLEFDCILQSGENELRVSTDLPKLITEKDTRDLYMPISDFEIKTK